MKRVGSFLGDWWQLVVPYFKSEDWRYAIPLLIGAIALTFTGVGLEVLFNDWNRRFYDSIQNKDEATFWREITVFSGAGRVLHPELRRARRGQPLPAAALAALAD